jgi:hypothetical protein
MKSKFKVGDLVVPREKKLFKLRGHGIITKIVTIALEDQEPSCNLAEIWGYNIRWQKGNYSPGLVWHEPGINLVK